jgi:hypothetical protein
MAKKKDDPELEEVIPETGDEDLIDQACQEKADSYEDEKEEAGNGQKPISKQHADDRQKPVEKEHAAEVKKPATTKQPTIDDLIANIHQEAPKAKVELPEHLKPKKKVWTPDQGVTKKEAAALQTNFDNLAKPQNGEVFKPEKTKVPPGFVSGPAQHAAGTDPQPFIFKLDPDLLDNDNLCLGATHFELLKVYASPVQKAQALVGVEALHPKWLYLWFDCFSGHAGNTTTKRIRVYLIKGYNEFASYTIKPNKMIDLPGDIQHVILTCADAPQIEDFEFLEPYMPIKGDKK